MLYLCPLVFSAFSAKCQQTLESVRIGNDTWTASNVVMRISDKLLAGKEHYEGLYTWEQAKWVDEQIKGWHLPSTDEWRRLEVALGSNEAGLLKQYRKGGGKLKEIIQIHFYGSIEDGVLLYKNERVYFWTSTVVLASNGVEYAFLKGLNNTGQEKNSIYHCGTNTSDADGYAAILLIKD